MKVSINSTSEEVRSLGTNCPVGRTAVSINSTSEEVRSIGLLDEEKRSYLVSINSTSEEVRSNSDEVWVALKKFPLIQLPRKSEVPLPPASPKRPEQFPLIQLPRKSEDDIKRYYN